MGRCPPTCQSARPLNSPLTWRCGPPRTPQLPWPLRGRWLLLLTLAGCLSTWLGGAAHGADLWVASPYQVRVWLTLESIPELDQGWLDSIPNVIQQAAEVTFGAAWSVRIEHAPQEVQAMLLDDLLALDVAVIEQLEPAILDDDKLIVVAVNYADGGFFLRVRELDCRSRAWQMIRTSLVRQPNRVARSIADEVIESFTPIGLIGRSEDDKVDVIMRAGLLTGNSDIKRLMPPAGAIFRGVMRKNDRLGKLAANGLQDIPWTLLQVESRGELANLTCDVISGIRGPFRSRSNRQIDKIALLVRPTYASTRLRLVGKDAARNPLTGYDVYYRLPNEKSTTFIGRSDWRGEVTVRRDQDPIKIMYVKNGGRLLARLPIVPGYASLAEAELLDDSLRLEAEGFLTGIQEQMIEIKARQQVYAIRIRRAMEDKNLGKAESLLDELRSLPTKEDLVRRMRDRQQSLISDNRAIRDRVDRMFRDTRNLIQKHLTGSEVDTLRQEVSSARS